MKKILYTFALLFVSLIGYSQKGISYQAIILDPQKIEIPGQEISEQPLLNGDVWMKFGIYSNSVLQFEEVQKTKTDNYGLINLLIGSIATDSFNSLVWDNTQKSLQVFASFNQGATYTKISEQKLTYNPYSLYSETAGKLGGKLEISSGGTGATTLADAKVNLGVDKVDNTSDANKPISTATQAALNAKVDKENGKGLSSNDFTSEEKIKLAAITVNVSGSVGAVGPAGPAGATGATGPAGATGPQGPIGLPGADGATGPAGATGATGPAGATGATGPAGATGATGPAGATGPQGLQGLPGADGATGPTGATGPIGPAGLTWKGAWSATGTYVKDDAVGFNGASYFCLDPVSNSSTTPTSDPTKWALLASQGADGLQGPTGPRGVTGATGPTGQTGPAGPQGTQGLTGPAGAIGPAGAQGIAGPIGPAGLTWKGVWSATGTYIKDDVVGFNGASYFCLASVSNSSTTPTSDPTKWALLASQGVDGPQGPTGPAGATGPQGPIGLTGLQGPTGATGAQGIAGSDGATGPQGSTGAAGPQGPIGLTGPAGPAGATGATGLLSSGNAAGNTPYWDGTQWVVNSSNLFNNGSNIGIGTTSPSSKLQLVASGSSGDRNNMLRIESNNNASLTLKNTNANAGGGEYQLFASSSASNPALGAGSLAIYYDHPTNAAYRFAINTAGNVGIGTGMPTEKLDVAGNVKTSGTLTAGTVTYPNTHGSANQVLSTTGSGTLAWTTPSSGGAGVPYTGATGAVNLGGYDLTVNGLAIGTGKVNSSGTHNTIVGGSNVARTFTSVLANTAIGFNTLSSGTPGDNNTTVGAWSLVSNSGAKNSAMGVGALERNLGGNENTAIGYYALRGNTSGSNNTAIGYAADMSDGLSNATAIGSGATVAASNTIQLGNTSVTNVKTSGTITAGAVTYPKTDGTSGQVLTTNGLGTLSWASASSSSGVPYTGATQAVNLGNYDLTVNGMTIGSGKINSTATLNTIVGEYALNRTSANRGQDNTAIGFKSMGNEGSQSISAGTKNTAVGSWTLITNSGTENSAVGNGAMEQNQGGNYNTAMGARALQTNLTGSNNTAIGYTAGVLTNNLSNATAIGNGAVVAASNTIQLGNASVTNVKTSGTITAGAVTYPRTDGTNGQVLTTNGSGTLAWASASSSSGVPYTGASQAVNLGNYDLTVNGLTIGTGKVSGAGTLNTIVGEYALNRTTSTFRGTDNTAIGHKSMGNETASATSAGTKNTAVGSWTLQTNSGQENSAVGVGAMQQNSSGSQNTGIGNMALNINSTGSNNTAIGYAADVLTNNLSNATAIGNGAKVAASNTIQLGNTDVTNVNTSGSLTANGVKIGRGAGNVSTNTAAGSNALSSNTSGVNNTAVGTGALQTNATGGFNTSVGSDALKMNTGSYNIAVGSNALKNNTSGDFNTAMGFGSNASHTSGSNNASFGTSALASNTGSGNTAIGANADVYAGISNASAVGFQAIATASNTIQLGNTSVTNVNTSGSLTAGGKIIAGASSASSASAVMEANSTTQGFLPPRMTYAQRNLISSPVAGLVLWCTNCGSNGQLQVYDGVQWTNMMGGATTTPPLVIGQSALGGIVAYVLQAGDPGYDANVQHGFIIPADYRFANNRVTSGWGCENNALAGADATAIGSGNQNTLDIITACLSANAAKHCADLVTGGYSDWYLPSKDELYKIFVNKATNGITNGDAFWSSSEISSSDAWVVSFSEATTLQQIYKGYTNYSVLPIRAF